MVTEGGAREVVTVSGVTVGVEGTTQGSGQVWTHSSDSGSRDVDTGTSYRSPKDGLGSDHVRPERVFGCS